MISLQLIEKNLLNILTNELLRTGFMFRIHSRVKETSSIEEKIKRKAYSPDGERLQDIIGLRITTFFYDDLMMVASHCWKLFDIYEFINDELEEEVFRPVRKNMICAMPDKEKAIFIETQQEVDILKFVDTTFEIQFRTTLSEGWHEVDHLMRYKCREDWNDLAPESRMLNGIYATLETNDKTLKSLFDDIAYHHYKAHRWEAMLRNKLRLAFKHIELDPRIIDYLNKNSDVARQLFRMDRNEVISTYINSKLSFPTTFDNWLYFINHVFLKDSFIDEITTEFLKESFSSQSIDIFTIDPIYSYSKSLKQQ